MRHRWDQEILKAVGAYIESAQRAISALYDEGRSRRSAGSTDPDSADSLEFNRRSREAMDLVRTTRVIARLHAPSLQGTIKAYKDELDKLKVHADRGFDSDPSLWPASKKSLEDALENLEKATGELLGLN